jgi:prophage DNA circulation protein
MNIKDIHNPWRDSMQVARFRGATFHVDTDARSGGRRNVLHVYPKRNEPYAEDMGRAPITFSIQAYLIGPNYLVLKDILISALEEDGPGTLQLPFPYAGQNIEVMAGPYTITESREKGGFCQCEMAFVEYGKPGFAGVGQMASAAMLGAAGNLQASIATYMQGIVGGPVPTAQAINALWNSALVGSG